MNHRLSLLKSKPQRITAAVVVVVVAAIGAYLLIGSHAAVPYSSIEAESGSLSSPATQVTGDSKASGGSYVQFGSASTTGGGPSGKPVPIGDIPGWHQIFVDDFTVNAPMGSWGTSSASQVVYTGDHGGQWVEYPDGWSATYTNGAPGYQPAQVLSVHNGELDFYLHNVNGLASGANPSPVLPGNTQYQTYGMYTAEVKVTYDDSLDLQDYHMAWLLWPMSDSNWQYAESDFPELDLNSSSVSAFAHYGGGGSQDYFNTPVNVTQWHTYTQAWGPGYRKYYVDGNLIGTSTNQVFSQPERWQLQTEPNGGSSGSAGHVLVDWVAVYSPA